MTFLPNKLRNACLGLVLAGAALFAIAPAPASALEEGDRAQIETIIREYLLANPELMLEVQKALEEKQELARAEQQRNTLAEMKDLIYSAEGDIVIGPENAAITIVEFYDYNCGFCRRALDDMEKILAADQDVRFILKEFPVLGQESLAAHRVSLAFTRLMPEKAAEFHRKLLAKEGRKDGTIAMQVAIELGADAEKLQAEIEKPDLLDHIRDTYRLADGLGITGTPSYVIGDDVVFGAVGVEQLNTRVANIRECGKALC